MVAYDLEISSRLLMMMFEMHQLINVENKYGLTE